MQATAADTPIQQPYVLRVEGVNFVSTLDDTEDISTLRGAGLALLAMPAYVRDILSRAGVTNCTTIVAGASLFIATLHADPACAAKLRDRIAAALDVPADAEKTPFQHLGFVVDICPADGDDMLHQAEPRNHARQVREWTVRRPAFEVRNTDFDGLDRTRPARPGGPGLKADAARSISTKARHDFGREMRQGFYPEYAQWSGDQAKGLVFTDSLQDMIMSPPPRRDAVPATLPVSLRSGIAVFYADGNGFRSISKNKNVGLRKFSEYLETHRRCLLRAILTWLLDGSREDRWEAFAVRAKDHTLNLRFETLLWGGDEVMFVMPAWLGMAFAEGFFAVTKDWSINGTALTHTAGLVFCQVKTPIRLARHLAHGLADGIKDETRGAGPANLLGVEFFESHMPPMDGVARYRTGLYGGEPDQSLTLKLAFPGDGIGALRAQCLAIAEPDGLPRSQLHRMVLAARGVEGGLAGPAAADIVTKALDAYVKRVRPGTRPPDTALPHLVEAPRPAALDFALILRLWDYIAPVNVPSFGADA